MTVINNAATRRASRVMDAVVGSRDVVPETVKVPLQIGGLFWAIKLISTCMGESLSDWLDGFANVPLAVLGTLAAFGGFVLALRWQFRATRYVTAVYWFAVAMVATFGTMAADAFHQFLGVPHLVTTLFYAALLAFVLYRWHRTEGTLSIHSITTRRREKYYWAIVLSTFALGTALGDLTATIGGLHYLWSGVMFAGIILIPAVAYRFGANSIAMFWFAYIVTRPLGASFADYLDSAKSSHGRGIAHPLVWGSLAVVMIALVCVLAAQERRRSSRGTREAASRVGTRDPLQVT